MRRIGTSMDERYAAPAIDEEPRFEDVNTGYVAHPTWLSWGALMLLMGSIGTLVFGDTFGRENRDLVEAAFVALVLIRVVLILVWLHAAWDAIPEEYRYDGSGYRIRPSQVIGRLFIPFYNLYWIFVVNGGLCNALDAMLRHVESGRRAPKSLASAACISQIIPYVNVFIAPFLWTMFMFQVDATAESLQREMREYEARRRPQKKRKRKTAKAAAFE